MRAVDCSDQGAEFIYSKADMRLQDILDSHWDAKFLYELIPSIMLGGADEITYPILVIQVNTLLCGGVGLGVNISHRLADASTLSTFLNEWAVMNREDNKVELTGTGFSIPPFFPGRGLPPDKIAPCDIVTKKISFRESEIADMKVQFMINEIKAPSICQSWCKLPFYEADFGFGKPIWVTMESVARKYAVLLLDGMGGKGVDAYGLNGSENEEDSQDNGSSDDEDLQDDIPPELSPVGQRDWNGNDDERGGEANSHDGEQEHASMNGTLEDLGLPTGPEYFGPIDTINQVDKEVGLDYTDSIKLGQSVLVKSRTKSIDLNENPKASSSGESQTWARGERGAPSIQEHSNSSIN
ncbi:hypothetical protein L2E82_24935 [Cichorium intybus]|uniref:Uncharacterized protein n=1 Tax=Cichorium intybus TaxID=13427 RepID=A0ACB9E1S7_CICIN|nr:hypothetical protein L2E82_24935 [Cichorium intybus]